MKNLNEIVKELGGTVDINVELDNLDRTEKLFRDGNGVLMVRNEHGTDFPASDLSKAEIDVFHWLLTNN